MAEFIGVEGIHAVSGTCDLCGDTVDPNTQELNVLGCTFKNCEPHPYHQDCLEKYLKSIRCERNRKTGFKCPRGTGKGTSHKDPCPGKIDKSHPIHPRNEEQKKKKKAKLPEIMQVPARGAVKDKAVGKAGKEAAPAAAAAAAKKAPVAAPKPAAPKPPPKPAPPPEDPRKKLAEAVAAARREIQGGGRPKEAPVMGMVERPTPPPAPPVGGGGAGTGRALSLDAFLPTLVAGSGAGSSTAAVAAAGGGGASVWGKPPPPSRPAAAAATPAAAAARASPAIAPGLTPSSSSGSGWGPPLDAGLSRSSSLGRAASGGVVLADVGLGAKGPGLVGAEYVEDEDGAGLTKAQKKNLKRAQKKKVTVAADTNSVASSDAGELATLAPMPAPPPAPMEAAPAAPRVPAPAAAAMPLQAAASSTAHVSSQAATAAAPVIKPAKPAPAPAAVPPPPLAPKPTVPAVSAAAPPSAQVLYDVSTSSSSPAPGGAAAGLPPAGASVDVSLLEEVARQGLVAFRASEAVAALVRLGFPLWAAAAGVQRHGLRLVEAIAWLLDVGPTLTPGVAVSEVLSSVPEVAAAEEEAELAALLQEAGGDQVAVYSAVLDAGGNLAKARATLLPGSERSSSASSYATQPAAAGTFGNGPGFAHSSVAARPVLPSLAPATDLPGWLPPLNGPSSMASLQPPTSSGLWQQVPGPEATLANWRQQQQQQGQQQPQWQSGGGVQQSGIGVQSATSHWLHQQQYSNSHVSLAAALPADPFTCSSPGRGLHGDGSGAGLALLGHGDSDDTDLEGLMATLMQQ